MMSSYILNLEHRGAAVYLVVEIDRPSTITDSSENSIMGSSAQEGGVYLKLLGRFVTSTSAKPEGTGSRMGVVVASTSTVVDEDW